MKKLLTQSNPSCKILTMKKFKEYFTVKEIAGRLGISRQAVDKRIKSRKVESEIYGKTRLISKAEMEKVLR